MNYNFKTTDEIKPITEFFAQKRALAALNFGIKINCKGFNIYAMGPPGIGKRSLIRKVLKAYASTCPIPSDWCYVHNFHNSEKPIALQLPAGYGHVFKKDMNIFANELGTTILSIFESDEYRARMQKICDIFNLKRTQIIKKK